MKQIADAGYAARRDDIRLTLRGRLTRDGDKLLLVVEDLKPAALRFALQAASSKDEKERKAFADAFGSLDRLVGKSVELEGWWRPAIDKKNPTATLLVRRVAGVSA